MTRINVYEPGAEDAYGDDAKPTLVGWFDDDKAVRISENRYWDGNNMAGNTTRRHDSHEALYHTAGGRWVLEMSSDWATVQTIHRFLTDAQAKGWLIRNKSDGEVERYFGELPEESGPAPTGRPAVGGVVSTALGVERLAAVDAWAAGREVSRAEAIRQLLDTALGVTA